MTSVVTQQPRTKAKQEEVRDIEEKGSGFERGQSPWQGLAVGDEGK